MSNSYLKLAKTVLIVTGFLFFTGCIEKAGPPENPTYEEKESSEKQTKLYWFIPDGLRADPNLFRIFDWAKEGELPNIERLMKKGAWGYSKPVFPSHTPTNFATLFTGCYPEVHGVADGPMHLEGFSLKKPSLGGFSSTAKRVPPIWVTMEKNGLDVFLLSIPGSTPPELELGTTVRGRWGGWGADFPALIWETEPSMSVKSEIGRGKKLFFLGTDLTRWVDTVELTDDDENIESFSPVLKTTLKAYGLEIEALIRDTTGDGEVDYDRITFLDEKGNVIADLMEGDWSDWISATLTWDKLPVRINTKFRINLIRLEDKGSMRVRFFYDNLNRTIVQPPEVSDFLDENIGPMMDFVDNFPPQLFRYEEDRKTFRDESFMTMEWHRKAVGTILDNYHPDVFIHDTYTPNQMLTSKWYMGNIDPESVHYVNGSPEETESWKDILTLYKNVDSIIGEAMKRIGDNGYIVLSSDHGIVPLNRFVRLNNFFANHGLLKFDIDAETGEPIIDWARTKVIYLKMCSVYINPDGLGGTWKHGSGPEYEKLRNQVIDLLKKELVDDDGERPLDGVWKWEEATSGVRLPEDRVGDLVIATKPGYGWYEEVSSDRRVFFTPEKTGYKQAILPDGTEKLLTPFIIAGPGIKHDFKLVEPLSHPDQYPTILHAMGIDIPEYIQGRVLNEIFE